MDPVTALLVSALGLYLLKRHFPGAYGSLKHYGFRLLKWVAVWLWRKGERKGGGTPKPPPMRWRE